MLFLLAVPEISMQIKGLVSNNGLAINTGFLAKKNRFRRNKICFTFIYFLLCIAL